MSATHRLEPTTRTLALASRVVLPVAWVSALLWLCVLLALPQFDVDRGGDRYRAMAESLSREAPADLEFDSAQRLQTRLAEIAASAGADQLELRREDGAVVARWPAVAPPGAPARTPPGAHGTAGRLQVVLPVVGRDGATGTLAVSFDQKASATSSAAQPFALRLAAAALLLLVLTLGWWASATALRRRRAEAAQQRSNDGFLRFIETLPDAVIVHRQGRIDHVNPSTIAMLGLKDEGDLIGTPYLELVLREDRAVAAAELEDVREHPVGRTPVELRFERSGGGVAVASVASVRLPHGDGQAVASVARDLTESRRVQTQLAFADRMMSVGTMASGIAHEINNPMTFVIGNLDLLKKGLLDKDDELEALGLEDAAGIVDDALEGAQRVKRIISDLKTFSRNNKDDVARIDVREPVAAAIQMASNEVKNRAVLVQDLQAIPPVLGSEAGLCQVFLNLIVNAAHAMPEGGVHENQLQVRAFAEGDQLVVVEIHDTGSGIPEENIPRLFDPFYTNKPVGEGTGLGLSICHSIVRDHGGEIVVESQLGVGTCFRVLLPVARGAVEPNRDLAHTSTGRTRGASILVIDDETAVGRLFQRVLAPRHRVIVGTSATEALDLLESEETPDVIFCDLALKDPSGMQLHARISRDAPHLTSRLVFTTGGARSPDGRAAALETEQPVLRKPFTPAMISQTVDKMVLAGREGLATEPGRSAPIGR